MEAEAISGTAAKFDAARHVYSRLTPDVDDRFHSYENSCELFNYILSEYVSRHVRTRTDLLLNSDSEEPVPLNLPEQWLWDIIDEFIYQYQNFCLWRSKFKSKSEEELNMLAEGTQV